MPYTTDTVLEKRVMMVHVIGDFTIPEFANCSIEIAAFLDTLPENQLGIVMFDNSKTRKVPTNVLELRKATLPYASHPKHACSTLFGMPRTEKGVINYITALGAKLFKQNIQTFETEAEAVNFIISKYPDLAHSLPEALQRYHVQRA